MIQFYILCLMGQLFLIILKLEVSFRIKFLSNFLIELRKLNFLNSTNRNQLFYFSRCQVKCYEQYIILSGHF